MIRYIEFSLSVVFAMVCIAFALSTLCEIPMVRRHSLRRHLTAVAASLLATAGLLIYIAYKVFITKG